MYKRILVPLDGSELAESALYYVEGIAKRLHSETVLLSACAPGLGLERPFRAYLDRVVGGLGSSGVSASPIVAQGNAANEILDFAEKNDIDLIVISTYGRTGPGRWAVGGVTQKVLQRSRIPILLIRTNDPEKAVAEKELRRILVPLDGSRFAEALIPYVEGLAEGMDSEVVLLRVAEPLEFPYVTVYATEANWEKYAKDAMAKEERAVKRYLSRRERALHDKGIKVGSASLRGKPAQTILQYAEDNSVSLIALATHGFSGITKWIYGSVASKIIDSSSKPVLLVRPPLPKIKA